MRTDVTIDRKQVRCPNASTLGFDKAVAQVGDILLWQNDLGPQLLTGRMIGRIASVPMMEERHLQGFIVAIVLSDDLSHTFERWVDPKDVTRVQAVRNHRETVASFLSDELIAVGVDVARKAVEYGGTLDSYLQWTAKRDADVAAYEARPMCACGENKAMTNSPVCIHCHLKAKQTASYDYSENCPYCLDDADHSRLEHVE